MMTETDGPGVPPVVEPTDSVRGSSPDKRRSSLEDAVGAATLLSVLETTTEPLAVVSPRSEESHAMSVSGSGNANTNDGADQSGSSSTTVSSPTSPSPTTAHLDPHKKRIVTFAESSKVDAGSASKGSGDCSSGTCIDGSVAVAAGSIPPLLANSGKQTSMERLSLFDTLMFNPAEGHLSCCGLDLKEIPSELADVYGDKTKMLDLSHNNLKSLAGIERFTQLCELLLDSNELGDDFSLPLLPSLTTLTLNKNKVLDLQTLMQKLRVACPGLTFLSLIGNGACPNGLIYGTSALEYARYRQEVVSTLPSILFLDSTPVSIADRPWAGPDHRPPAESKVSRETLRRELVDTSTATLSFFDDAAAKKNPLRRISLFKYEVTGLALLADKWVVTSGSDGVLKVFDLSEGRWQHKCVAILKGHATRVRSVACFTDVRVVSASDDRTIRVWNLAKQTCVRTLKGHQGPVRMVQTMKDGRIASCSDDSSVCVWETARNTPITLSGHIGPVHCVEVVSETLILSGGSDATIKFWDLADRSCLGSIMAHGGPVSSMVYLGAGRLASGSTDSTIKVWQLSDSTGAECIKTFRGHWNGVSAISQVDDNTLISAGGDRLIAHWDLQSGRCKAVLGGHASSINAVVTRKVNDGTQVASCGEVVKLWTLLDPAEEDDDEADAHAEPASAQSELVDRFNDATEAGVVESEGSSLWDVVVKVLTAIQHTADNLGEPHGESDGSRSLSPVAQAYTTLTTDFPSTISMFVPPSFESSVIVPPQSLRNSTTDRSLLGAGKSVAGVALHDFTSKALHAFFSNESLSNPLIEINAKVQAWKDKMKRRRGPNVMDWLGGVNEKRTEEALDRLVQLCEMTNGQRLTYLAIKNRLIDEFGEDVYSSMKEQVSVELAMRDLEGVKPDEIATAPERHTAAPHQFFPETTRLIAPHISTQEDDEDGGLGNDTPYIPRPKVDVATLYSMFDQIGELCHEESGKEMELAQQFEARLADLEAGEELDSIPYGQNDDELYAYVIENSRLMRAMEESMPPNIVNMEPEVEEVEQIVAAEEAPLPIDLVLQHEVWA